MPQTPGVLHEFVGLPSPTARRAGAGGHPCQGIYHRGVGRRPKVAMIATHYQIDFSEHYLADYIATRGIGFLGWNTRFRGFESSFLLDHALVDIGVGLRWLRDIQGVETIVLLGNSGGGSLMAAYQSQAKEPNVTPLAGMRPAARTQRAATRRRVHRQRGAPRAARRAHRLDGRRRRRRERPAGDGCGPRHFRRTQWTALLAGVCREVPRRAGGAKPCDHRLGGEPR